MSESNKLEPETDLPETIGDESADPEEFLNDFCSDDAESEHAALRHLDSPLF